MNKGVVALLGVVALGVVALLGVVAHGVVAGKG